MTRRLCSDSVCENNILFFLLAKARSHGPFRLFRDMSTCSPRGHLKLRYITSPYGEDNINVGTRAVTTPGVYNTQSVELLLSFEGAHWVL